MDHAAAGHQARILVVDDQRENQLALTAILTGTGVAVRPAGSGAEALRALAGDDYAVVLLDVAMPGMDGFETAYHIQRGGRGSDVPIVLLAPAGGDPATALRGYAAGAVDYLAKPFDPWVVRSKVGRLVELDRARRSVRAQSALLDEVLPGAGGPARLRRQTAVLRARLTEMEDAAAALAGHLDGVAAKEAFTRLDHCLGALRAAHRDLFGTGPAPDRVP
ncbi:response regulator [Actinomadura parmotrematis]|uniref:Response regulator n=1 Tax=Actinomadura parmotrematis TaxID=2864039 RepID=A0ABS7G299_9ACTN|nr:response regulator [Actinomadura parmotrematis]MBW8486797.1 response regulator [Actinomadura parmotrematis]